MSHSSVSRRFSVSLFVAALFAAATAPAAAPSLAWEKLGIAQDFFGGAAVCLADVDQDGFLDIVAAARGPAGRIAWFRNPGGDIVPVFWREYPIDPGPEGVVVPAGAVSITAGDIDRDGDPDVAVAFEGDGILAWYARPADPLGARSWPRNKIGPLEGARSVVLADIDGDRDLDAVAGGITADAVVWFANPGWPPSSDELWPARVIDRALRGAAGVFALDIDQDRWPDVVAAGSRADSVVWYKNPGPLGPIGPWAKVVIDAPSPDDPGARDGLPGAMAVWAGDLSGDGKPDVAAVGATTNSVVWYQAPGDPSPTPAWLKNVLDVDLGGACAIVGADIDRDGTSDLVACGSTAGAIAWYWNPYPRDVLWQKYPIDLRAGDVLGIAAGGLDADSFPDVAAVASRAGTVSWYRNPLELEPSKFVRGDAHRSAIPEQPDVLDLQAIAAYLAREPGHAIAHYDAADANDDGFLTAEDYIRLGRWLFVGPPPLPAPFPEPGEDPTKDTITQTTVAPPDEPALDTRFKVWLYWATAPEMVAGPTTLLRVRMQYPEVGIPEMPPPTQAHAAILFDPRAFEFVGARGLVEGWDLTLVEFPAPAAVAGRAGIGLTFSYKDAIRDPKPLPNDADLVELRFMVRATLIPGVEPPRLVYTVGEGDPAWLFYYTGAGYFEPYPASDPPEIKARFTVTLRETGSRFIRGDANADAALDIADAVVVLSYLFGGGYEPSCMDTADINDDGGVDVSDPVYLLAWLFAHGSPPPRPFGRIPHGCGLDPTHDTLSCNVYPPCYDPILP